MPPAPDIADAVIHAALDDGTRVCIRTVRPGDEERMRQGIAELSAHSRYLRFFSVQPMPSDAVIDRLLDADGHRHLAWGAIAVDEPGSPAIGAVHAIRPDEADRSADFAVAIVDAYHGLGLARMLTAVLLTHCRIERIAALDVQVLSENQAARALVASLGGRRSGSEFGVVDYTLETAPALLRLAREAAAPGLRQVLAALSRYR